MVNLTFDVRSCVSGEQMLSNGKCKECEGGYYLLDVPTDPNSCKICDNEVAICLGGNRIYPRPGYWRSSPSTDVFY